MIFCKIDLSEFYKKNRSYYRHGPMDGPNNLLVEDKDGMERNGLGYLKWDMRHVWFKSKHPSQHRVGMRMD